MKFYYNGKLVRTSKTHEYKYALMLDGKCLKCSATKEGAQAEITRLVNECKGRLIFWRQVLKASESGTAGFYTEGKYRNYVKLDHFYNETNAKEYIEHFTNRVDYIKANAKVVELEARA